MENKRPNCLDLNPISQSTLLTVLLCPISYENEDDNKTSLTGILKGLNEDVKMHSEEYLPHSKSSVLGILCVHNVHAHKDIHRDNTTLHQQVTLRMMLQETFIANGQILFSH